MSVASSSDISQHLIYMNVPKTRPLPEMSFEENRMHDYVVAYQTTGGPPQPTPQEPFDAGERTKLGLAPLFEPYSETGGFPTPLDAHTLRRIQTQEPDVPLRAADVATLPDVQLFTPTMLPASDTDRSLQQFQSIVLQEQYAAFSFEELRVRAYWSGKRYVPEAVTATAPPQVYAQSMAPVVLGDPLEQMQSITCQPGYSQYSFEELRLQHQRAHQGVPQGAIPHIIL
ncbi:hypothetical protein PHLGIDRAFT_116759 [Phlebiopsis gigantea 11061_1 CR5-6]|uniref:Uncharacterized protein n=1 Tax=Phlebiopsis gigantea (strain 11061_1 CR5-6) TaxID=745531 RepID=A0A0C3PPU9_PHLG1|nr:hypothetical protein PHLGIDRAFT_116759 [Phlebiopsis gigantea 11061_1 CR5-6]